MNLLLLLFAFVKIPSYTDFLNILSGNPVSRGFFVSNFLNEPDFIKKSPSFFKKDTLSLSLFINPWLEEKRINEMPYFLSVSFIFPMENLVTGIDFDVLSGQKFTVYTAGDEILKNYTPKSFYIGTFFSKRFKNFNTGAGGGISRIEEPTSIWPYEPEVYYLPSLNLGFSFIFNNFDLSFSALNISGNLKKKDDGVLFSPLTFDLNSSFKLDVKNIRVVPGINFEKLRNYKGKLRDYFGAGFEIIKKGNPEIYIDAGYILRENRGFVYGFKIRFESFKLILSETGLLTNYGKIDFHLGMEVFFELVEI